jgi:hypothetical protein
VFSAFRGSALVSKLNDGVENATHVLVGTPEPFQPSRAESVEFRELPLPLNACAMYPSSGS